MHDERSQRPGVQIAGGQRGVEGAALAILVERRAEPLTLSELVERMNRGLPRRPYQPETVERAVGALVEVGLLRRRGARIVPTPAALRAAELELGL